MPFLTKKIPAHGLVKGRWYVGRGRNGNVGLWNGEDFLVVGSEFATLVVKQEPYYTEAGGTFQPFLEIDEGLMVEPFGSSAWQRHYGRKMEFSDSHDRINAQAGTMQATTYHRAYEDALQLVLQHGVGSVSLVQRHMRISYSLASSLVESMETNGLVTSPGPDGLRQVIDPDGNVLPIPDQYRQQFEVSTSESDGEKSVER
jgi:hypothetical protein